MNVTGEAHTCGLLFGQPLPPFPHASVPIHFRLAPYEHAGNIAVRVSLRSVAPAHSWLPRLDRQSPLARFSCELPTPEVRRAGLKGGDLLIGRVVWGSLSSTRGEGAGAVEEYPGVTRAVAKLSKTVGISIGGGSACSRGDCGGRVGDFLVPGGSRSAFSDPKWVPRMLRFGPIRTDWW